jgi:peroxin-19
MSTEDQLRYDKQYNIVGQVVEIFETPGYSDDNQATTTEIVSLMSEVRRRASTQLHDADNTLTRTLQMQEYGSPPAEIMGALPPGFVSVVAVRVDAY